MSIWMGEFIGLKEEVSVDSADKYFNLSHCNAGAAWKGSGLSRKDIKPNLWSF